MTDIWEEIKMYYDRDYKTQRQMDLNDALNHLNIAKRSIDMHRYDNFNEIDGINRIADDLDNIIRRLSMLQNTGICYETISITYKKH